MKNLETMEWTTELIGESDAGMILKVKRARLEVIKGPDKGYAKDIPLHGLMVGKSPSCSFALTDPAVSSEHFRLIPTSRGFFVEDLGSSNGTWLQKVRLGSAYMAHKERIDVGYSTLRLDVLGDHQEYPVSVNSSFGEMIGTSVAMRQVFAMLERAAQTDSTLLLEGETGCGKDLAAESVHLFSERGERPFIVVDCGNMHPNLVESHLFGHVKGSFTGASSDHMGAFEAARGGTVFLDEIGELDSVLQPRLLRVIEKRQVQRVGEATYRPVDVRLIAATHRHLDGEVKAGRFREDLFYRLSVLRLHIPSLRDRREDIPLLANAILRQLDQGIAPETVLSDSILTMLCQYHWPGNVRELRNVIERLLVFPEWPERAIGAENSRNRLSEVGDPLALPFLDARNLVLEDFEEKYVSSLLHACSGVVARAARKANVTRQTMHRLINKYGLFREAKED
jgi:DNA-binding NtrC family response regulator